MIETARKERGGSPDFMQWLEWRISERLVSYAYSILLPQLSEYLRP